MCKLLYAIIIFQLLASTTIALGQEFPTRLATMGNKNPEIIDSLNGKCSSADNGKTLDCVFTTTSVDYYLEPDLAEKRADEFFRQAKLIGNTDDAIRALFDNKDACLSALVGKQTGPNSELANNYKNRLIQACELRPNTDNARKLLTLQAELESKTCKVWGTSGGASFKRSDVATWSLRTEPEGSCDVYEVFKLQCDPENLFYCDYDEYAVYGNTQGEYCEGFKDVEDEGDHYSSSVTMNFEMDCAFIQFTY